MTRYSYKKYGFDKTYGTGKRKNIPPPDAVPIKVWAIQLKTSYSLIEVAPIHNALIFTSEIDARHYLGSEKMSDRHNYKINELIVTTEKYIRNRVQKALNR